MNKTEIIEKLRENHREFVDSLASFKENEFMFSVDEKWTAGQQLEHLIKSVKPLNRALSLPNFIPSLIFGKVDRNSLSYQELVSNYQSKLASGGKAPKRFVPPKVDFSQSQSLQTQLLMLVEDLTQKIDKFSESKLDETFLPHPLLGNLTIREMLYFTIYHAKHHHTAMLKNLDTVKG